MIFSRAMLILFKTTIRYVMNKAVIYNAVPVQQKGIRENDVRMQLRLRRNHAKVMCWS
jgi:hypothetical protein